MKKSSIVMAIATVLALGAMTPALGQGQGTQIKDAFIACYDGTFGDAGGCGDHTHRTASQNDNFTMGDAISSGFFGNTANPRPSGNGVLPSQSPGPFSSPDGEPYACHLGDVISNSVRGTGEDCDAS